MARPSFPPRCSRVLFPIRPALYQPGGGIAPEGRSTERPAASPRHRPSRRGTGRSVERPYDGPTVWATRKRWGRTTYVVRPRLIATFRQFLDRLLFLRLVRQRLFGVGELVVFLRVGLLGVIDVVVVAQ